MTKAPRQAFLGVQFDPLGIDDAVQVITAAADSGQPFGYVTTPNVDHLVRLDREPELAGLYDAAALVLCDSRIVQPLARLSGLDLPVAPGADIAAALFDQVIRADDSIVIIGGSAETASRLSTRFGLTNARFHAPPMGLRQNPAAIDEAALFVEQQPARFVFLCVGSPQQEMIASRLAERGRATGIGLCIGAALEFLSGEKVRAPAWMRKARLEWLHRLASEPKRLWQRYLVDGPAILSVWWRWRRAAA